MTVNRSTVRRGATRIACIAVLGLALAGCENIKDQLGFGKQAPNEFNVVTRAPLTLPPDYNLRPPAPGQRRPQEQTVQDRAKEAIVGSGTVVARDDSSAGESAMLGRVGRSDANIRSLIDEENALFAEEDESVVDTLIFWQEEPPPGVVVDPTREAQRLQEADALGNPPTQGETAIIEHRDKGILEGFFESIF